MQTRPRVCKPYLRVRLGLVGVREGSWPRNLHHSYVGTTLPNRQWANEIRSRFGLVYGAQQGLCSLATRIASTVVPMVPHAAAMNDLEAEFEAVDQD